MVICKGCGVSTWIDTGKRCKDCDTFLCNDCYHSHRHAYVVQMCLWCHTRKAEIGTRCFYHGDRMLFPGK